MDEQETAVALAELRKEIGSLKHRMNDVENVVNVVHQLAQEMVGLTKEVSFMNHTLAQLTVKVADLEKAPGKRWEGLVTGFIGAAIGIVLTKFFG